MRRYIERVVREMFSDNIYARLDRIRELEKKVFALENHPKLEEGKKYTATIIDSISNPNTFTCISAEPKYAYSYIYSWTYTIIDDEGNKKSLKNHQLRNIKEIKCEAK
jgi:hypothetical protein